MSQALGTGRVGQADLLVQSARGKGQVDGVRRLLPAANDRPSFADLIEAPTAPEQPRPGREPRERAVPEADVPPDRDASPAPAEAADAPPAADDAGEAAGTAAPAETNPDIAAAPEADATAPVPETGAPAVSAVPVPGMPPVAVPVATVPDVIVAGVPGEVLPRVVPPVIPAPVTGATPPVGGPDAALPAAQTAMPLPATTIPDAGSGATDADAGPDLAADPDQIIDAALTLTVPAEPARPPALPGALAGSLAAPVLAGLAGPDARNSEPAGTPSPSGVETRPASPLPSGVPSVLAEALQGQTPDTPKPSGFEALLAAVDPGKALPVVGAALAGLATVARVADRLSVETLAVDIAVRAKDGQRRFEIRLDPPELGRIDVSLEIDSAGVVKSHLIVEKPDTLDLLRRDAPQLERALHQAGLKTGDGGLEFSLRDERDGNRPDTRDDGRRHRDPARADMPDDELPATLSLNVYARPYGASRGLDIRI